VELTLKNRAEEKTRLSQALKAFASSSNIPAKAALAIDLALEELITNIISYAFPDTVEHTITVRFEPLPSAVRIQIEDDGIPFNPVSHPSPATNLALDDKPIGGLGIHMARRSMDSMEYERVNDRNRLTLVKKF
jgi:anti-sigma regulatory factor (Ser/Thr protein kinase)